MSIGAQTAACAIYFVYAVVYVYSRLKSQEFHCILLVYRFALLLQQMYVLSQPSCKTYRRVLLYLISVSGVNSRQPANWAANSIQQATPEIAAVLLLRELLLLPLLQLLQRQVLVVETYVCMWIGMSQLPMDDVMIVVHDVAIAMVASYQLTIVHHHDTRSWAHGHTTMQHI